MAEGGATDMSVRVDIAQLLFQMGSHRESEGFQVQVLFLYTID